MDFYDTDQIIRYASTPGIDISPTDRKEWVMFCCALKVLGYGFNTFVALSNTTLAECKKVWDAEKNPGTYCPTQDKAKAKIVALAKSKMDLTPFKIHNGYAVDSGHAWTPPPGPRDIDLPDDEPSPAWVYVDPNDVEGYQNNANRSNLYKYLCSLYPSEDVRKVFARYRIGATEKNGTLWSTFPLINAAGHCVDVHMMPYHVNGHRMNYHQWRLNELGQRDHRAPWPLFGEHLLETNPTAPVGLVESEKTALIATLAAPGFIWMATLSKSNLNEKRCSAIHNRDCYIFPDADGVESWRPQAGIMAGKGFRVCYAGDYIARYATGEHDDLADIIARCRNEAPGDMGNKED